MRQDRWRSQLGFISARYHDSDQAADSTPGVDFEFALTRRRNSGEWRLRGAGLGEARLVQGTWPTSLVANGPVHADTVATCFGVRGNDRFKLNGNLMRPGTVIVNAPGSELVVSSQARACWNSFQMSRCTFEREWQIGTGRDALPDGLDVFTAEPASEARLCRAMEVSLAFAEAHPERLLDPAVGTRLQRLVQRQLFSCLEGRPRSTPWLHRSVIRRIAEFLQEHPHQFIDQMDLCRTLSVTDRALRHFFAAVYGTSPGKYLRVRRLHQARRSLRSGWAATVTDVAVRFGFFDLGRFAALYRAHFGELPSQTLACRRRQGWSR